jgi:hypothetical protein
VRLLRIDTRSLALFRIALGLVLLTDLLSRARHLSGHYTDAGVLPRSALFEWIGVQAFFSPHSYLGEAWWQLLLFAVAVAAAMALLLGYRTRLATLISWFLLVSLHSRNPVVIHGGDNLLRVLLLWSTLLPLGTRWSLDRNRIEEPAPSWVGSPATAGILLQICLVYWFSGALKWNPTWLTDQVAVAMALNLDHLTTEWGRAMLAFPALLRLLSQLTVWLEVGGPLLLWLPLWTGPIRFGLVLTFVSFHLIGLAPAFHLGSFPWVCATAWLLFLPTWMWDRLLPKATVMPATPLRREPSGGRLGRRAETVLAVLLFALALFWNAQSLDSERSRRLTESSLGLFGRVLGINQAWNTFAPTPPADDGWFVMPAKVASGPPIDAWRRQPVSLEKPEDVATSFGSKRWNKYLSNLSLVSHEHHRPLFGAYLCRESRLNPEGAAIEGFQMVFLREKFDAPQSPPEALLLWEQPCT